MREWLLVSYLGWGATREYAKGVEGYGDIDSGPVVAGIAIHLRLLYASSFENPAGMPSKSG